MANPFFITINCSKILCDSEEYQFTMFIDNTKMTIVYELTEWIRWIFSLDECFYLTHNNSVIHELEDISVLSILKNFELKPCGQFKCIHKRLYKTLLNKLDLFVCWKDINVPKFFLEKLSLIEQKLTQQNQLCMHDKNKPELTQHNCSQIKRQETKERCFADCEISSISEKEMCNESTDEYFEEYKHFKNTCTNTSFKKNRLNKYARIDGSSENERVNRNTETNTKQLEEAFKVNKNKLERCFDTSANNFNSNLEPPLLNKSSSPLLQNKNSNLFNIQEVTSPVEDLQNQNDKLMLKDDKDFSVDKTKKLQSRRFTKPFSLGQILSNLRDECKNKTNENNCNSDPNVSPSLYPNKLYPGKNAGETPTDDFNTVEKRKRKRTRRSRSKKHDEAKEPDILVTSQTPEFKWNIKRPLDETKPNHIRFDLDDGDKFMETDHHETNEPKRERLCSDHGINEFSSSEIQKTNIEDLVSMINEKKQALSGSNVQNTCDKIAAVTKSPTQTQKDFIALEGEDYAQTTIPLENFESNGFSKDLSTLMQLKEKFPSPVVIERFF